MTAGSDTCLFCRIVDGDIPAALVHTDDAVVAFRDVNPQAPLHVLVVPRTHITSIDDLTAAESTLWGRLLAAVQQVTHGAALGGSGWRLVVNTGADGGQTVAHLHLHVLGGRHMNWPPG